MKLCKVVSTVNKDDILVFWIMTFYIVTFRLFYSFETTIGLNIAQLLVGNISLVSVGMFFFVGGDFGFISRIRHRHRA